METIKKYWGQKTKAEKYLEFVNEWLTVDAIADNYGISKTEMEKLLNEGKIEHNKEIEPMGMKVFGIDADKIYDGNILNALQDHYLGDDEFMEISEKQGFIWNLEDFAYLYNTDNIKNTIYIRFI